MTAQITGYPFEVLIPGSRSGAVLAGQVKSLDWRAREAGQKGKVASAGLAEVKARIFALIGKLPIARCGRSKCGRLKLNWRDGRLFPAVLQGPTGNSSALLSVGIKASRRLASADFHRCF
ncbi:MAG: hypothetical protein WA112_04970 [Rugosibacter sp.]|jgi:mRNA interferase MazF